MTRVYVSSTHTDLTECREQVRRALRRLGVVDVAMEYDVAEPERPLDRCLADVASCDLYIGIFAWRYGHEPPGEDASITELEYRAAVAEGKDILVFLLDEEAPWPRKHVDRNPEKIEKLRAELRERWLAGMFTDPPELVAKVSAAVSRWLLGRGQNLPAGGVLDAEELQRYYTRLGQAYGRLDLDVLTPPHRGEYLQLTLRSVFVEPDVVKEVPPVELPKELWQLLAASGDAAGVDLPADLDADHLRALRDRYREQPRRRVLDVLAEPGQTRVVVLGDPGAGKSTLARYLILSLADGRADDPTTDGRLAAYAGHLPLLVELRAFVEDYAEGRCTTFCEYVDRQGRTSGLGLDAARVSAYLDGRGPALVVFDGLDEISDPRTRAEVTSQIAWFATRYPSAQVLVTSRSLGYSRGVLGEAGFTHVTLQDLDAGQVGVFLKSWYTLALHDRPVDAKAQRERLLAAIAASPSIAQLAGNPLLLTILAIIGRREELPRDRAKVYDHAATVLVHHWDVNRHLVDRRAAGIRLDEEDKKALLRRLARRMQNGDDGLTGNRIDGRTLREEFEGYLLARFRCPQAEAAATARVMIDQFRERNFILSRYGGDVYGFVHRAFLEFFCAEEIRLRFAEQDTTVAELKADVFGAHWREPAWREVLRLLAGAIGDRCAGEIITYLVDEVNWPWPADFGDEPPWNLALAAQCLAELRVLGDVEHAAERVLARLIQLLEHCRDVESPQTAKMIREEILDSVASVGPAWPRRVIYLNWFRNRGSRLVRAPVSEFAITAAGDLFRDSDEMRRMLLRMVDDIADEQVLGPAWRTLIRIWPDPAVRTELIDRVHAENDEFARAAALTRLAVGWPDQATRTLLTDHAADGNGFVRAAALERLAVGWPDDATRVLLTDHVTAGDDEYVRAAALERLAVGWPDQATRVLLTDHVTAGDDEYVRASALERLAVGWPDQATRTLLTEHATTDGSWAVRAIALTRLAVGWPDEATRALLTEHVTADGKGFVRAAALERLAAAWPDQATRTLLTARAAADGNEYVREAARARLAAQAPGRAAGRAAAPVVGDDVQEAGGFVPPLTCWPEFSPEILPPMTAAAADADADADVGPSAPQNDL
jgi:hypothetical protein